LDAEDVHSAKKPVKTRLRARFSFLDTPKFTPNLCAWPPRLRLLTGAGFAALAVKRVVLDLGIGLDKFLIVEGLRQSVGIAGVDQDRAAGYAHRLGRGALVLAAAIKFGRI